MLSIIIIVQNKSDYLQDLILNFNKSDLSFTEYEIIIAGGSYIQDIELDNVNSKLCLMEKNSFSFCVNRAIKMAKGNKLALLHDDVVLSANLFAKMQDSLKDFSQVGLVGCLTNNGLHEQTIRANYKTREEMLIYAEELEKNNKNRTRVCMQLSGCCMMFNRALVQEIGWFDEDLTEDGAAVDYCLRAIKAGKENRIRLDTFIHHYNRADITENDRNVFFNKHGIDPLYSLNVRFDLLSTMNLLKSGLRVLEVGCASGATLQQIKAVNSTSDLYGIELNQAAADIAGNFACVDNQNVEKELSYPEEYFDYILFGDVLEHLNDPWEVCRKMKKYLHKDGYMLASIPNVMHISNIKNLLAGFWSYQKSGILDKTHLRFFTLNECVKMFQAAGYREISYRCLNRYASQEELDLLNKIIELPGAVKQADLFLAIQFLITAKK